MDIMMICIILGRYLTQIIIGAFKIKEKLLTINNNEMQKMDTGLK